MRLEDRKLGHSGKPLPRLLQQRSRTMSINRDTFMPHSVSVLIRRPLAAIPKLAAREELDPRHAAYESAIYVIKKHGLSNRSRADEFLILFIHHF
jgi:hypothetical protein